MERRTNLPGHVSELGHKCDDKIGSIDEEKDSDSETAVQITCQEMQELPVNLVELVDEGLWAMISDVLREVQRTGLIPQQFKENNKHKNKNRKKSDKPGSLPEKQFVPRNSLLTDLIKIKHIRTIYNIFIVILIIFFLNSAADDIVTGNFNLNFDFIQASFGQFSSAISVWCCMFAATFSLYACFYWWANQRAKFTANTLIQKSWDYGWLVVLIVYQACFLYFPARYVLQLKLPPASATAVLLEQVRMVMKSHAFVRSNVPRARSYNPHGASSSETAFPAFSSFVYFYFCPTLVYRDNYLRTKTIRWWFVGLNLMEVIGTIFYMSFIFVRFFASTFRDFGQQPFRITQIFDVILPAILFYLCFFYCLLHSWMNAWAEMMRFADRMFYQDWWNVNCYAAYYRRWNVIVHDWLYTYIYKDVRVIFLPNKRFIPTFAVFAISAIVHEYMIALAFGFFYPVLMIMFGTGGMALFFVMSDTTKGGNLLVWLGLMIGTGLLGSAYCVEWYSRVNCQQTQDDLVDFFVPRSWTCVPVTKA